MRYVNLGSSTLKVSRLALGCMSFGSSAWRPWVLDLKASLPLLQRAWELGINFFDTANVYSTGRGEALIGQFVRSLGAGTRDSVVVATKLFYPVGEGEAGLSRRNVLASCDASLARLGLDHIDLLHREDERELLPLCIDQGIGVLPWSPVARGRMARAALATPSGSGRSGSDDTIATLYGAAPDPVLDAVAAAAATQSGLTAAQVAIAWLAAKPGVVAPLLGVTRAGQLEQVVAAIEHVLQAEQIAALECTYTPRAYADLPWTARNLTVLRPAR